MDKKKKITIITDSDVFEKRVDMLYGVLAEEHSVRVITTEFAHREKKVRKKEKPYEYLRTLTYKKNMSLARLRYHRRFARDVFKLVEKYDSDILWILIPGNSMVKEAEKYKKNHENVKIILDFIDMWPESLPVGRLKKLPPFAIWRNLRDKHLNGADLLVTECNLYHRCIGKNLIKKPFMKTLYWAEHPYEHKDEGEYVRSTEKIKFCYLGSVNNIIDIDMIRKILEPFGGTAELHIIGGGEKLELLVEAAGEAGAAVLNHGFVFDGDEKFRIMCGCHYGLNIMKQDVFVGLTMKSIDYLNFNLPIVNTIKGDTWEMVNTYGMGINIDDTNVHMLPQILAGKNTEELRKNVRRCFDENFSYEKFSREVNSIISLSFRKL